MMAELWKFDYLIMGALNVLALDGGVRGLLSLLILQNLMQQLLEGCSATRRGL